jgi:murein L,D-transpeptidase YafK
VRALLLVSGLAGLVLAGLQLDGVRQSMPVSPATTTTTQPPAAELWASWGPEQRLANVELRRGQTLDAALKLKGFQRGDRVFLRVIKESSELELWLQPAGSPRFQLYHLWPIAVWSGQLGPKQKEGDCQAPEGCYAVTRSRLNPRSRYHLSFDIGYPNAFDQSLKRSGSALMIHGKRVSIGCYAMTDPVIEEIYLLVAAAIAAGQAEVAVQCFPFRMTPERLTAAAGSPWLAFWTELKAAWDLFETTGMPATWRVDDGHYRFTEAAVGSP